MTNLRFAPCPNDPSGEAPRGKKSLLLNMKRIAIVLGLAAVVMSCARKDWQDASLTAEERASLLLKEMTLEEKVGQMCQYVAPCYVEPGRDRLARTSTLPTRIWATRICPIKSAEGKWERSCT